MLKHINKLLVSYFYNDTSLHFISHYGLPHNTLLAPTPPELSLRPLLPQPKQAPPPSTSLYLKHCI